MDKAKIIEEYDNEKLEVWHDDEHKRAQEYAPIIRCKYCKHAVMTVRGEVKYCKLWQGSEDGSYGGDPLYLEGDFFCAYAEGKEEC